MSRRPPQDAEDTRAVTIARWLPPVLIAGGVGYDLLTPEGYHPFPFYATASLVAASFYSWRGTVTTGVAALAAVAASRLRYGTASSAEGVTEVIAVGLIVVLALFINHVLRLRGRRLALARETSAALQRAVLPTPEKRIGGLDVAARYEAAQEESSVGGDVYAVQDTPYGLRLLVGDVRGKGLAAIAIVAVTTGAFREAVEFESDLTRAADRVEGSLERERPRYRGSPEGVEGFVTAVFAEVPPGLECVRLVNRGHPPPLLLYRDGTLRRLESTDGDFALPLGLGDLASGGVAALEYGFPPGSTLLMYTDGLSEARNEHGDFYDPEVRLAGRTFPTAEALLSALVTDVRRHTRGVMTDDLALLAVRRPDDRDRRHQG